MSTSITITGASGFIGKALVSELKKLKIYKLYLVSKTQKDSNYFYTNSFASLPKTDVIFHLGQNSDRHEINSNNSLVEEALNDLEYIISNNYKQIIFCSSASVYGDKGNKPFKENDAVYEYDNYSFMKIESEKKVLEANGCVLRLANVIGLNMSKNTVLMDIISQLGLKKKLIVNDIKSIRDFVPLDHVLKVMLEIMKVNHQGIYNVGTGREISVKNLIKIVLDIAGETSRNYSSKEKNLKYSYNVLNIKKLKKIMEIQHKTSIEDTLYDIIKNEKKSNSSFYGKQV